MFLNAISFSFLIKCKTIYINDLFENTLHDLLSIHFCLYIYILYTSIWVIMYKIFEGKWSWLKAEASFKYLLYLKLCSMAYLPDWAIIRSNILRRNTWYSRKFMIQSIKYVFLIFNHSDGLWFSLCFCPLPVLWPPGTWLHLTFSSVNWGP